MNTYQKEAAKTIESCNYDLSKEDNQKLYAALGLHGEAGEVTELIKKDLFKYRTISKTHLIEELGDLMWYLTTICTLYDINLADVIDFNLEKIKERYLIK